MPALFSAHQAKDFTLRNYTYLQLALGTIIARILVSYIFIKPYYDYKVYSIYEYLTARFGVPTKNAASAVFLFTRLLASGTRLYAAAIALALAYEMIRGVQPGQKETLFIYIGSTVAIVILTADLHNAWWNQSRHLDRLHSSVDHDRQCAHCSRVTLFRNTRWLSSNRSKSRRLRHFGFLHDRFESGHAWMGKMERDVRDRVHNFCRT